MIYPSVQRLQHKVEQQLRSHPQGISEHTLIKQLQALDDQTLAHGQLCNSLDLFQLHFILFHTLYLLRDKLWQQQKGDIKIEPSLIRLWPYRSSQQAINHCDPLRDYYLDLDNLETTDEQQVNNLLTTFWKKLANGNGRKAALDELGLCEPVDDETIKKTWRQLMMQHHPDRGGDKAKLQLINAAMDWLKKGNLRKP